VSPSDRTGLDFAVGLLPRSTLIGSKLRSRRDSSQLSWRRPCLGVIAVRGSTTEKVSPLHTTARAAARARACRIIQRRQRSIGIVSGRSWLTWQSAKVLEAAHAFVRIGLRNTWQSAKALAGVHAPDRIGLRWGRADRWGRGENDVVVRLSGLRTARSKEQGSCEENWKLGLHLEHLRVSW